MGESFKQERAMKQHNTEGTFDFYVFAPLAFVGGVAAGFLIMTYVVVPMLRWVF